MSQRNPRRIGSQPAPTIRSSGEELESLVHLSGGLIIKLTGPLFPSLSPRDAAHVLMFVALGMPKGLRVRTMHLAVNLFETDDWSSEIIAAARHGDPDAQALASAVIAAIAADNMSVELSGGGPVS